MKWMTQCQSNKHSQGGEDGVIDFLLKSLEIDPGNELWCVEIGAWDGVFLSNTLALIEQGYNCVMVEADPERFDNLRKNASKWDHNTGWGKVYPVQSFIEPDNAAEALKDLPVGVIHAVMSIDIDGTEPAIWQAIHKAGHRFAVVLAEWKDYGKGHPWALLEMAHNLGYTPVHATNSNLFFVRSDLYGYMCHQNAGRYDK